MRGGEAVSVLVPRFIYGLADASGAIRYVGATTHPKEREGQHRCPRSMRLTGNGLEFDLWRVTVARTFRFVILDVGFGRYEGSALEVFWIAALRVRGCDLLNIQPGGRLHLVGPEGPDERRRMWIASLLKASAGGGS